MIGYMGSIWWGTRGRVPKNTSTHFSCADENFSRGASLLPGVMVTSDHNITGSENGENSSETTLKR